MRLDELPDNEKEVAKAVLMVINAAYVTPRLDMAGVQRVLDALATEWREPPAKETP